MNTKIDWFKDICYSNEYVNWAASTAGLCPKRTFGFINYEHHVLAKTRDDIVFGRTPEFSPSNIESALKIAARPICGIGRPEFNRPDLDKEGLMAAIGVCTVYVLQTQKEIKQDLI